MNTDFLIEKKLNREAPELNALVKDSVVVLQNMLEGFLPRFPDFTDHSLLHSMDVLDYCNRLLGEKQIERLSAAECYVIIMSCYLHDMGMGINQKDYAEFSAKLDFGDYFETHKNSTVAETIRFFHQEYSGHFIRKYAELLEIPDDDFLFSVVQVSRGHRKTDLLDEREYPVLHTEYGVLRLAFLAALVRLADEIDVGSDRNPELLFDGSMLDRKRDLLEFGKHESIRNVSVTKDRIILNVIPKAPEFIPLIVEINDKIGHTLDYCRRVTAERSDFEITQDTSVIKYL